jgi:hypothetical protein
VAQSLLACLGELEQLGSAQCKFKAGQCNEESDGLCV